MYRLKIYYEDTDTGGVVYYANYLRFFERARTEELRSCGVDVKILMEQGYFFVVTDVTMKLHSPARYGDELEIETTLTKLAPVTMMLEYKVKRGEEILVTGTTRMACVDRNMQIAKFPDEIREKLKLLL